MPHRTSHQPQEGYTGFDGTYRVGLPRRPHTDPLWQTGQIAEGSSPHGCSLVGAWWRTDRAARTETIWISCLDLESQPQGLFYHRAVLPLIRLHAPWALGIVIPERMRAAAGGQIMVTLMEPLFMPQQEWEDVSMVPISARPRNLRVSSVYIMNDKIRRSIPMTLKAQSTWTLLWTRENLLHPDGSGRMKPIDSTCVFHMKRWCSNMLGSKPILIHAMAIRKIRYCSKCLNHPGTIFNIQEPSTPPEGDQGQGRHTHERQPPMWETPERPGRQRVAVQSHVASGSPIPEVRTTVFGINLNIPEENIDGGGYAAE